MKIILAALSLMYLTFPMIAVAREDGLPEEEFKTGLFGTGKVGTVYVNTDDRLFAGSNDKRINAYSEQNVENAFRPSLSFQLNYKTQAGTKYYFGTPAEEVEPKLTLGVAQTFADKSILDIAVDTQFLSTVWKDPYITGIDREDTSVTRYGTGIKYDRILGTGLKFQYRYTRQDVDEDVIGARLPDLKRDGDIHKVDIGGGLRFGQKQALSPSFFYIRADMTGESNSYDGYGAKLQYRTNRENLALALNLSADRKDYRKIDPIFVDKREDRDLTAMANLTWMNPLGYERFFVNLGTGFHILYSNIDFYDSRTTFGYVNMGYNF